MPRFPIVGLRGVGQPGRLPASRTGGYRPARERRPPDPEPGAAPVGDPDWARPSRLGIATDWDHLDQLPGCTAVGPRPDRRLLLDPLLGIVVVVARRGLAG